MHNDFCSGLDAHVVYWNDWVQFLALFQISGPSFLLTASWEVARDVSSIYIYTTHM